MNAPALALALLHCLPHVDRARGVSGGDGDIAAMNARAELSRYADELIAEDCQRNLSPEEAQALHAILGAKK